MKSLYVIYQGKPTFKRVLLRKVEWNIFEIRNIKTYFKPNFKSVNFWFWNIQLILIGSTKYNDCIKFRLLNLELEIGW